MNKLINFKKLPYELASVIAHDAIVQRLLINDSINALDETIPALSNLQDLSTSSIAQYLIKENYISIAAPTESGIENYTRNTFIIINIDSIDFHDGSENNAATGSIFFVTDDEHQYLSNNRLRLFEIADAVINILDNRKFSSAGTFRVESLDTIFFSEFQRGYRLVFTLKDIDNTESAVPTIIHVDDTNNVVVKHQVLL